jgi:hypothetical protein
MTRFFNTFYSCSTSTGLLSITHLMDCGADIQFAGKGCTISDEHGEIICEGRRQEDRYIMDMRTSSPASARMTVAE